ncbi:50S ribosomal protein L3 [Candidatus Pacearchaeota archaeon]|nr:50S ribosomal protein L3 [Candidatus Pacearchaeota archaeon]
MPPHKTREGSLQFWPRGRASKLLPRVNWKPVKKHLDAKAQGILGVIAYKVGMVSASVKDLTDKSMTTGKKIIVPATVLEIPAMKVASVRFYHNNIVAKECIVTNEAILKKILHLPKQPQTITPPAQYEDIRVLVYSLPSQTNIKKTPDVTEFAVHAADKLAFVTTLLNRELTLKDIYPMKLVDARGLTTGRGFSGAVKRYGISLKQHKSEKGRRRPGSLGPWHPARVTFRTPYAGQFGMFTRVHYNLNVITTNTIAEKNINPSSGFPNFGLIKAPYMLVSGSVQGPVKRQIVLTPALRPTKHTAKRKYEFQEVSQ